MANLTKNIKIAFQNINSKGLGAYTGEISAEHVKDLGLEWVIIGHSERRTLYGETNEIVAQKVKKALQLGLKVIACIGQKLSQREAGETMVVVKSHLDAIKSVVKTEQWRDIVIAYEPVWAIGDLDFNL